MKKILLFLALSLGVLCFVGCGKKILGIGSNGILMEIENENITPDDLLANLSKYGEGKKFAGVPVFYVKYAKTVFKAFNNGSIEAWAQFQIESEDEINAINQFVEEFNKVENNNIVVEYSNLFELNNGGKVLRYYCYPKSRLK